MSSVTKEAGVGFQTAWLGSVGYVAEINDKRERPIWLEERWLNKLVAGWRALAGFWQAKASATGRLVAGQRAIPPLTKDTI